MNRYSENIMRDVRKNLGLPQDNNSRDDEIIKMSKNEVFRRLLAFHGFIFYERPIKNWIKEIWGVDLEK